MNKFIKYSLSVASATLLFASCSGFLDENPTDLFGDEDAYKNPSLIYINTVANIYAQFGGEGDGASLVGVDRGLYDLNTFSSDEAILPVRGSDWTDGGTWRKLFLHRWSNNETMFTNTWKMNLKQVLESYYQTLKKDDSRLYNMEGIRNKISSEAMSLLSILDKKEQEGVYIDDKIFSFLNFISGYDTPRYEDDEYLYEKSDLDKEYKELGDIDSLEGVKTEICLYIKKPVSIR